MPDKTTPIPPVGAMNSKYHLYRLEKGDHEHIEGDPDQIKSAVAKYAQRSGRVFTTRKSPTGRHVWRVA